MRKRGEGPKPPGERRNRGKKKDMPVTRPVSKPPSIQHNVKPIEWRGNEPSYVPPSEAAHPGARAGGSGYSSRRAPNSPRPVHRTLEDAVLVGRNVRTSAPIPRSSMEDERLENLKEERERECIMEKLETHEKKLALMIVRLDRTQERMNARLDELDAKAEQLDSMLKALSTLISTMDNLLSHYNQRRR